MKGKQHILMILDGVGNYKEYPGNAFKLANTPNIDALLEKYPTSHIHTSGKAVGLPDGQMGNSEVGHTNIGAGRIVYQELTRITKSIEDGDFFQNEELLKAINNVKGKNSTLHIMGLVSDGGVHSHIEHLYAILELAKKNNISKVYIHAYLDGRDTNPASAIEYLNELQEKIDDIGAGKIATLCGRYYSMDRDKRYDRLKLAYDMLVNSEGQKFKTYEEALNISYKNEVYDEFVKPVVLDENAKIKDSDSVIFFNFRPDRAREMCHILTDDEYQGFERKNLPKDLTFVTFTKYDETLNNVFVAYKPQVLKNTLGEYVSSLGLSQLRIAETEKYAHVTFFFNGGEEVPYKNEDRILVPSPKVATYDLKPEMSALEVTDKVLEAIDSEKYNLIILNFANGDMVGHTGKIDKAIIAVETVDKCVGKIIDKIVSKGGEGIITADHGNCEYMLNEETGEIVTSHSTFDVPIILVSDRYKTVNEGSLCDLAPTMLKLMELKKPEEMTGKSLI